MIDDGLVMRVAGRLSAVRAPGRAPRASAEPLLHDQPELLAFVLAGTADLSAEARAWAIFLTEVIHETFLTAGRRPRPIPTDELLTALERNRDMAIRVGRAHDRLAARYLRFSNILHQPALIRWVTGVLLEPDGELIHELAREELGPLFVVLKSIIDVLDLDVQAAADAAAMVSSSMFSSEPC